MLRSSTIFRELALNVAKVIFMLKHSVELRRYFLCGCVAPCHGMACVLHAVQFQQGGLWGDGDGIDRGTREGVMEKS